MVSVMLMPASVAEAKLIKAIQAGAAGVDVKQFGGQLKGKKRGGFRLPFGGGGLGGGLF